LGGGLLAQCDPSSGAACELPTGLPWYFGLFLVVVWAAVVVGAVLLFVRLVRTRRGAGDRRSGVRDEHRSDGSELERW
jgi:hypothetical protein